MWKRLARRAGTNTSKSTTHTHPHTHTPLRWEVCNFKLRLRKHVASDGSVCGNWLWKTEPPWFSWQDVILVGSLEYKTLDERKSGTGDDDLSCEFRKNKKKGSADTSAQEVRKKKYRNQSHTFDQRIKCCCCCCLVCGINNQQWTRDQKRTSDGFKGSSVSDCWTRGSSLRTKFKSTGEFQLTRQDSLLQGSKCCIASSGFSRSQSTFTILQKKNTYVLLPLWKKKLSF